MGWYARSAGRHALQLECETTIGDMGQARQAAGERGKKPSGEPGRSTQVPGRARAGPALVGLWPDCLRAGPGRVACGPGVVWVQVAPIAFAYEARGVTGNDCRVALASSALGGRR